MSKKDKKKGQEKKPGSPIPELPIDMYEHIAKSLDLKSMAAFAKASAKTAKAARRPNVWRDRLEHDFPHHYQRIAKKADEGAALNFEALYQKAYDTDYKGLNKRQQKIFGLVKAGDLDGLKKYEPLVLTDFLNDQQGKNITAWASHFKHESILNYINTLAILTGITPTDLAIITHRDLENYQGLEFTANSAYYASMFGNLQALRMIAKSNPDLLDSTSGVVIPPLLLAAKRGYTECVQFLLNEGVNIKAIRNGYDALMWAIKGNYVDTAKVLIDAGSDLKVVSTLENMQAIHLAAKNNCHDIAELLLAKDKTLVNQVDIGGQTPLIWAASLGHADVVKLFIDNDANLEHIATATGYQWTALQWAVFNNHTEAAEVLLDAGANSSLAYPGHDQKQPIHIAAEKGNINIVKALLEENPALINAKDANRQSALSYAAKNGHFEVEKLLLSNIKPFQAGGKYKSQSFFWAKRGESRDLLRLNNIREKYLTYQNKNKDYGEIKFLGITWRFASKDKRVAAEHLMQATLDKDQNKLSDKDKRILKRSPEFRLIYKHLKPHTESGGPKKMA